MFKQSNRLALYPVIAGLALVWLLHGRQQSVEEGLLQTQPVSTNVNWVPASFASVEEAPQGNSNKSSPAENAQADSDADGDESPASKQSAAQLDGALVRIPLPIVGQVDVQVRREIERAIERLPTVADSARRSVLVLEFDLQSGANGEGSELERCVALARYLTSPQLSRVRTVAYIPESDQLLSEIDDIDADRQLSELRGHAVLVALSCEQMIMENDTAIGAAGIDEKTIDEYLEAAYRSNTQRRRLFPEPLVMSLLDKERVLYRVNTSEGDVFADRQQLEKLESENAALSSETVSDAGLFPLLDSETLLEYRLIRARVSSRHELADRLGVRREALLGDPSAQGDWNALQIKLQGPIHKREVDWILNALSKEATMSDANLLIVEFDTPGGDPIQCLRLAERLAEFDSLQMRTVGFVSADAGGYAALAALACDHLVMSPDATLGGPNESGIGEFRPGEFQPPRKPGPGPPRPGQPPRPEAENDVDDERVDEDDADVREALMRSIKRLAPETEVSWSLLGALVDPSTTIRRMRNRSTGQVRFFSSEELAMQEDPDNWADLGKVNTAEGLTGTRADELGLTRQLASSMEEVKTFYQLEDEPRLLQPTLKDKWILRFARYLSSPMIAGWLLFGTMFFFMVEMSNPGIGVPGFIATIFCMLFFWSQYCDGNANWLEILMFVVGLVFIAIEVFVVPGVGVFGIGGGLMLLASIVLASQDFLWPRNAEELARLPASLSMLLFAGGGIIVSAIVIRTFLPHIPLLNKMILNPPGSDDELETLSHREAMTHFEHLVGKRGVAMTPLLPSGKAEFGGEVHNVITDGRGIEKGQAVIVRQVVGNRIEVAPD